MLRINDTAPDFTADTSSGTVNFHEWIGDGWAILFSHPKDFTPVCATELGHVAKTKGEFDRRDCKVIGLSVDSVEDHQRWASDIEDLAGTPLNFPIIADGGLRIAKLYNMLPAEGGRLIRGQDSRRQCDGPVRVPDWAGQEDQDEPDLPYEHGRNFDELLRVIDSCQLTAQHKVATPANWNRGEDVIISPAVNNDAAKELFPDGWQTVKPYLRKVKDPSA